MKIFAAILAITGAAFLSVAFFSAKTIPPRALGDLMEAQKARGYIGGMPGYDLSVMEMGFQRRMLQDAYIGSTGLVLLLAGVNTLCRERKKQSNS